MGILSRLFASKSQPLTPNRSSGLIEDDDGWYYEEAQDYSSTQQTIRIEQDRPGDWRVRDSFCKVDGLNEPDRLDDVERFFAGSYRWLSLERRPNQRHGQRTIAVIGTTRGLRGKEQRHHIGYLAPDLAEDLGTEDVRKAWSRIRFIKFPGRGRRPQYLIRFDLMVEGDEDTFE